jgi:hypothetical protein
MNYIISFIIGLYALHAQVVDGPEYNFGCPDSLDTGVIEQTSNF